MIRYESSRILPKFALWPGWGTPAPDNYRIFTGVYEVACSLAMLISGDLKTEATGILAAISGGAVFTHLALKDNTSAIPPSVMAVLLLFLFIRSYLSSCHSTDKPSKFKIPKKLKVKWCVNHDSTSITYLILGTIYYYMYNKLLHVHVHQISLKGN